MTGRLGEIEARIAGVRDLREVVTAMRGIAAARTTQAQAHLASIAAHADIVAAGLADALARLSDAGGAPPDSRPGGRTALLLVLGEHGFVGAFNEPLVAAAAAEHYDQLLVLGSRGVRAARERGLVVNWSRPMPTQARAVTATAREVTTELYRHVASGQVGSVVVIRAVPLHGGRSEVVRQLLLPLDYSRIPPRRSLVAPLSHLEPGHLVERIAREYVLAELSRVVMEGFASENGARLAAMQASRHNIDERLGSLSGEARTVRQGEITSEVLDIVTGSEALASQADA